MPAGSRSNIQINQYIVYHPSVGYDALCWIDLFTVGLKVGQLQFYSKQELQPYPVSDLNSEEPLSFVLRYEISRYPDIIETLRYVGAVYVDIAWEENWTITRGLIKTYMKPVGQQEGEGGYNYAYHSEDLTP